MISINQVHVSVVLNMHREAIYLRPTLFSLDACAVDASENGINVELIAVFDRPDAETLAVFQSTQLSGFVVVKTIVVDFGSLGLARNAGIDQAEGEFVWTADGDDLVSRNALVRLVDTARKNSHKEVAIFIEYLVAFGTQYHVARYVNSEWLTAADFAYQHPYVSRIFIKKAVFEKLRYRDLKVTTGFAYEDWDFNCRLLAAGFVFIIAPYTLLFYRQRRNSLLQQANALSSRMIPHSAFFEQNWFSEQMSKAKRANPNWSVFLQERINFHQRCFTKELIDSEELLSYIADAAALEPELEPQRIQSAQSYFHIPLNERHWGFCLDRLYKLVGNMPFTDVVLVPWLKPGGAEKYILQILGQLQSHAITRRILVLSGQSASKHEWARLLPKGSVFIDLFNTFPSLDDAGRNALAARAILAVSEKGGRLHLKTCTFTHQVMEAFGAALSTHLKTIYYRFSDERYVWKQNQLSKPWGVTFLREQFMNIDRLVSDCRTIVEKDTKIMGVSASKYHVIYTYTDILPQAVNDLRQPRKCLIWASRVSSEKRPELVCLLAAALRKELPDICIEVYGKIEAPYNKTLFRVPGVKYRGAFGNFSDIPFNRYDALVYTSMFDGLPNIILEAMGAGLPVIAPDVGGIAEAVIDQMSGFLVPDLVDEASLINSYVQTVKHMYNHWDHTLDMRNNALRLIKERHGQKAFAQRIAQVFETTTMIHA
ncbi:MAG: glycosyltransferase [Desulfobulbaceae bacterium]|nr:glycosyltransferase [Desulfobulbaceae bacterium]